MSPLFRPGRSILILALIGAGLAFCPVALAQPSSDAVLLDGLSTMAGGRPSDESGTTPVLISDVRLEAELLLVRRLGPDWRAAPRSPQLQAEARRVAAMVALLARQARQMGEEVELAAIEAARAQLTERAGGTEALDALLARFGVGETWLARWLESTLLATAQVRYLAERVEPPTDADIARLYTTEGSAGDGQDPAAERAELRRKLRSRQVARAVAVWLEGSLERSLLRLLR